MAALLSLAPLAARASFNGGGGGSADSLRAPLQVWLAALILLLAVMVVRRFLGFTADLLLVLLGATVAVTEVVVAWVLLAGAGAYASLGLLPLLIVWFAIAGFALAVAGRALTRIAALLGPALRGRRIRQRYERAGRQPGSPITPSSPRVKPLLLGALVATYGGAFALRSAFPDHGLGERPEDLLQAAALGGAVYGTALGTGLFLVFRPHGARVRLLVVTALGACALSVARVLVTWLLPVATTHALHERSLVLGVLLGVLSAALLGVAQRADVGKRLAGLRWILGCALAGLVLGLPDLEEPWRRPLSHQLACALLAGVAFYLCVEPLTRPHTGAQPPLAA